jgi:hypothetical protein
MKLIKSLRGAVGCTGYECGRVFWKPIASKTKATVELHHNHDYYGWAEFEWCKHGKGYRWENRSEQKPSKFAPFGLALAIKFHLEAMNALHELGESFGYTDISRQIDMEPTNYRRCVLGQRTVTPGLVESWVHHWNLMAEEDSRSIKRLKVTWDLVQMEEGEYCPEWSNDY